MTLPAVKPHDDAASFAADPATRQRDGSGAVTVATLIAALALAACSAAFSISGLTAIFAGAVMPVTGLGIAFEIGKLSGVAWLGRARHAPLSLRVAVMVLIGMLVAVNSAGVFGYLSRAHLARMAADEIAIDHAAALVEGEVVVLAETVADLDRRLGQIDGVIAAATARGRTQSALAIIESQSRARAGLVDQRRAASEKLAGLKVRRAEVAAEGRKAEADDIGPLRFLASIIGAADDQTLRIFLVVVSLMLDPGAVILMLAATYRRRAP